MKNAIFAVSMLLGLSLRADRFDDYRSLIVDDDLYVGEAADSQPASAAAKAEALARVKKLARGALAESIQVWVKSSYRERQGEGGEEIEAETITISELELENVRFEVFDDVPAKARFTVVAWLTKKDYADQVAGRRQNLYRAQWAFTGGYMATLHPEFREFFNSDYAKAKANESLVYNPGYQLKVPNRQSEFSMLQGFYLQARWREWVAQFEYAVYPDGMVFPWDPANSRYTVVDGNVQSIGGMLGYDVVPWRTGLQPYFPLRLRLHHVDVVNYSALLASASAGLGLRWWLSRSVTLDLSGAYVAPLNRAVLRNNGTPILVNPGKEAELGMESTRFQAGVVWSGF